MRIFTDQVALPCFLDFEASGFGDNGYPIEVAWSLPTGHIECHLIRPTADWVRTGSWNLESARIHGIPFDSLYAGREPGWLCQQMNAQLAGKTVFCDGLPYDQFWLERLFDSVNTAPSFSLESIQAYCFDLGLGDRQYEILSEQARKRVGAAHRAEVDVRYLIELYRMA